MTTETNEKEKQKEPEKSPFLRELRVTPEEGFESEYSLGRNAEMTCKLDLSHPIELSFRLNAFHEDMAKELDYSEMSRYIEFCMQEVARYWLKFDPKRFGELIAQSKIRGHCIQDCDLED